MPGFVIDPNGGERFEFNGGEVRVLAMPEQTGIGGFSVETFPPGFASPLHIHRRDGGVFFVLEGTMRIRCGDLEHIATPGSMVYLPPEVPHAFRVEGDSRARWFSVQSPHGDFMLSTIARSRGEAPALAVEGPGAIETVSAPPF
jgi:mannose-6-phosphate isomerase-like protein (cupin superfamily)